MIRRLILSMIALTTLAAETRAQGLKGEYYNSLGIYPRLPDALRLTRVDAAIAFSDDPTNPGAPWSLPASVSRNVNSARWTGSLTLAAAAPHHIAVDTDNAVVVLVDGAAVVDLRGNVAFAHREADVDLAAGPHFVEIFYARGGLRGLLRVALSRGGVDVPLSTLSPRPAFPASFGVTSHVVDFEGLPRQTRITEQFAASAGVHVIADTSDQGYRSRPIIETGSVTASGAAYLYNDSRDPVEVVSASAGVPLRLRFDRGQQRVAMAIGMPTTLEAGTPHPAGFLRAFDAAGNLVGADLVPVLPSGVTARVEVARSVADIAAVTVDYGGAAFGEAIDDLVLDTPAGAPALCTAAPPQLAFVEPRDGQELMAGDFGVSVTITVRQSCGSLASAQVAAGSNRAVLASATVPGCAAPACSAFTGVVTVPPGSSTLTATATNVDGQRATARVAIRVRGPRIHVRGDSGLDVAGAEVYIEGARATDASGASVTDAHGNFDPTVPLRAGMRVVVRSLQWENHSPRPDHARGSSTTPAQNWNYRVYQTNVRVNNDGTFAFTGVSNPSEVQEVRVTRDNTLIGIHVMATVEWDASTSELDVFRGRLNEASSFLYNASDGQFYFEQVDLLDDAVDWNASTDYRIYADNTMHPYVNYHVGGFLDGGLWPNVTWMNMRGMPGFADQDFVRGLVFAHEFGHFGLALYDEYLGWVDAHCTDAGRVPGAGPFNKGQPRASCMMWSQWDAPKLCSDHAANPHTWVNFQGTLNRTDCWHTIRDRYEHDPFNRLRIQTPTTRGAIVGPLSGLPARDWATKFVIENGTHANLCQPITISTVDATGASLYGARATILTTYGQSIFAGLVGPDGTIQLTGLHVGDVVVIDLPFGLGLGVVPAGGTATTRTISAAECTPAM